VPKKIGKFKLELIGNRGTTIFPGPMPEVMLVDWYRLRYLSTKKKIITSDLIFLLEEFERKGYDIVQVVKVIQQTI
jgi:hypothetical protein